MKNTVIANRKKGDWEIIKKYFEDRGVDLNNAIGYCCERTGHNLFYYGVIDGKFDCRTLKQAQQAKATILEVSDIEKEFKVGDIVVVTQNTNDQEKVTEITCKHNPAKKYFNLKGCNHPYKASQMRHATPEEINQYKGISDTVTLPKSFVLEAHKSACSDWKKRIEEVVPELFVKKEMKGWYWFEGNLVYYNEGKTTYGFWNEKWKNDLNFSSIGSKKPATEQEVFEALKNEAVKRGYKEGVRIDMSVMSNEYLNSVKLIGNKFEYDWNRGFLDFTNGSNGHIVFQDGKWAEIISEPIPQELESLISKLGKDKILEYLKD